LSLSILNETCRSIGSFSATAVLFALFLVYSYTAN